MLPLLALLAADVRVSVFGLFRPNEVEIRPRAGSVLVVDSAGEARAIEGAQSALLRSRAHAAGRQGAPAGFVLSLPGRIRREFFGRLEVIPGEGALRIIVEMDRETAVASIVAAESPPGATLEALKAQAVVSRSFLAAARRRHEGFDFCDTTHCQFLRHPPGAASAALRAAADTVGLILLYEGRSFEALYSADCGGRTRTPGPATHYPYFAVECAVRGPAEGHGIGLCQRGAAAMAKQGADFRAILAHYFPGAAVSESR